MGPWRSYQELPRITIPPCAVKDWPWSKESPGYDPQRPWRVLSHHPGFNYQTFDAGFHDRIQEYDLPKAIIYGLAIHRQLVRFADQRQTQLQEPPAKDGSNTHQIVYADPYTGRPLQVSGSPGLHLAWKLYSTLVSFLHREGFLTQSPSGVWNYDEISKFREILQKYPARLRVLEAARISSSELHNQLVPGFEWIHVLQDHLIDLTCSLQAILRWCREPGDKSERDPRPHFARVSAPFFFPSRYYCSTFTWLLFPFCVDWWVRTLILDR